MACAPTPVSWWDLSQIPEDTTLYDAIMLPTVQWGPLKIILPILPKDVILEEIDD
ncbi:MAG: hypothetical protein ACFFAU_17240 [Candidatus Hodarchaeota archaeon]